MAARRGTFCYRGTAGGGGGYSGGGTGVNDYGAGGGGSYNADLLKLILPVVRLLETDR